MTSRKFGTQDDPSTLNSKKDDSNKSWNVTTDIGQRKKLVTSSPLQKNTIHQGENSGPHGSKHFYTGSDNAYTEHSHDEKQI